MTPKAYIHMLRLKETKRLLLETDEKIIDIAALAGFGSLSAFNRFFKDQMGDSPAKYRKEQSVR